MTGSGAVWALGAMSGTSLDGVDAAMVLTDGRTITSFGESAYQGYTDAQRETVRKAFGRTRDTLRDEEAAEVVETVHAAVLSRIHGAEVVGFHGQTLWHDPDNGVTLQVGDGAVLSEVLGLPVVWDFRTTDVLMGGQGAPLAPFFHHACARHVGAKAPVAFLNLGGVGNLTWVDPRLPDPALPGALLAFDTGPANAPINDLVTSRWGEPYDRGGAAAARGNVADAVIERMLAGSYFSRVPPKSLDRDHFSGLAAEVADLSDDDAAATLTCAAAAAVARGMVQCPEPPTRLLVTGGGRRNPVLMEMLSVLVDFPVAPVEDAGLDGDMLEAQAFAYLAVRVMQGLSTSSPGTTGVRAPVGGGTISRPGDLQVTRRLPGAQPAGISKSGSASVKPSN